MLTISKFFTDYRITVMLLTAIILGSTFGLALPGVLAYSDYLDMIILALIFFIFLEVPFEKFLLATKKMTFIATTWATNFIIIPIIGFIIAYMFLHGKPEFLIGLLIYFLFPCTDWFLAFTKLAKGDTATGSVLLPINLVTQILFYPVYLIIFASISVAVPLDNLVDMFINWFLIPLGLAVLLHMLVKKLSKPKIYEKIESAYSYVVELLLAVVVFIIFQSNIGVIAENSSSFVLILFAVFIFFLLVYVITEKISDLLGFPHPLRVLYTMTTSARNAPLMLAITTVAIPNQPLIYAAIVIGMLVEFPHLVVLSKIMTKKGDKKA